MRVLHIGKFYPPAAGGIERALESLAQTQLRDGLGVGVLAHAPPRTWRTRERDDAVALAGTSMLGTIHIVEAACWGQLFYAPISPSFPLLLKRAIEREQPDVLHIHMPNTSAFWALLTPAARRLPWIVHWHSDIPLDTSRRALRLAYPLYRPWEQALLRRADAVIATSHAYCDASSALRPWHDKTSIIALGIDDAPLPAARTPAPGWPPGRLRLLAVGRLSHYKGFDVLLRALTLLPQIALQLIGSGECEAELRAQVIALGLSDRVRMRGHVDDAELARCYAEADVFCLPSLDRAEAFGLVLLEAMRAGLPVVASAIRGSGVAHVVRDDETGLLVPPGDAARLAATLSRIAADEPLRAQLGAAGRTRWANEFSLRRMTDLTTQLYRSVLARTQRRAATAPRA